jgi:hypothetical protein
MSNVTSRRRLRTLSFVACRARNRHAGLRKKKPHDRPSQTWGANHKPCQYIRGQGAMAGSAAD